MKKPLSDFNLEQIKELCATMGEKGYRALQLYEGITLGKNLEEMTNLPKAFIQKLAEDYTAQGARILKKLVSRDGTVKYLFALNDDNVVEGVVMKYKYGNTVCVSTQVGCRMNCSFCASGLDGLVRNMSSGEMLSEVLCANRDNGGAADKRAITNVVLMGSGEPMDNYDNVRDFLVNLNAEKGLNISMRNISISTCGLVEGVDKMLADGIHPTLTFSLHAPNDEIRTRIMPINKAHNVSELIEAAKRYFNATGRRVIFEYALISGVNDSINCAEQLANLVRGFPSHVNLIALNFVKERGLKGATPESVNAFLEYLTAKGVSATLRRTMGEDINGACGQLRRKYIG